jgi:hypothetical protein
VKIPPNHRRRAVIGTSYYFIFIAVALRQDAKCEATRSKTGELGLIRIWAKISFNRSHQKKEKHLERCIDCYHEMKERNRQKRIEDSSVSNVSSSKHNEEEKKGYSQSSKSKSKQSSKKSDTKKDKGNGIFSLSR